MTVVFDGVQALGKLPLSLRLEFPPHLWSHLPVSLACRRAGVRKPLAFLVQWSPVRYKDHGDACQVLASSASPLNFFRSVDSHPFPPGLPVPPPPSCLLFNEMAGAGVSLTKEHMATQRHRGLSGAPFLYRTSHVSLFGIWVLSLAGYCLKS